jgi:hypothetical protein
MEEAHSPETSINFYKTSQRHTNTQRNLPAENRTLIPGTSSQ